MYHYINQLSINDSAAVADALYELSDMLLKLAHSDTIESAEQAAKLVHSCAVEAGKRVNKLLEEEAQRAYIKKQLNTIYGAIAMEV